MPGGCNIRQTGNNRQYFAISDNTRGMSVAGRGGVCGPGWGGGRGVGKCVWGVPGGAVIGMGSGGTWAKKDPGCLTGASLQGGFLS